MVTSFHDDILPWSATGLPASAAVTTLVLHAMIDHIAFQTPPSIFGIERNRPPPVVAEFRKSSHGKTMRTPLISAKIYQKFIETELPTASCQNIIFLYRKRVFDELQSKFCSLATPWPSPKIYLDTLGHKQLFSKSLHFSILRIFSKTMCFQNRFCTKSGPAKFTKFVENDLRGFLRNSGNFWSE